MHELPWYKRPWAVRVKRVALLLLPTVGSQLCTLLDDPMAKQLCNFGVSVSASCSGDVPVISIPPLDSNTSDDSEPVDCPEDRCIQSTGYALPMEDGGRCRCLKTP